MTSPAFVTNWPAMWEQYLLSKHYRARPSEMLGIESVYMAYCFDNAVWLFGQALEAELGKIEGRNSKDTSRKQDRKLRQWLDLPLKYRNPVAAAPGKQSEVEQSFSVKGELT